MSASSSPQEKVTRQLMLNTREQKDMISDEEENFEDENDDSGSMNA